MKRIKTVISTGFFMAASLFSLQAAWAVEPGESAATAYSISIVPQFEQRKLYSTWKPIVDELERRTGLRFNLITTLTIQDFHNAYARGEFDFVYVNPYHVMHFHDSQGYIPLVADKLPLRGIIVVRKDGPINTPADLDGKTVAFPSPNALGASLLVRSSLEQLHHVRVSPIYVKTHSSVYLHVAKGLAAAGGGVEKTLQEQDESLQAQLRVIYTTRSCPSHPIAAHPRVSPEVRDKVRKALFALGETAEGKKMLKEVPIEQLIPVAYEDYATMRNWGLEKYWQTIPQKD
ncbi:MAG: phosphate/phosphite/phosphonate ABC transporter substrate-binding protein [Sideroxyarcus sp.]